MSVAVSVVHRVAEHARTYIRMCTGSMVCVQVLS